MLNQKSFWKRFIKDYELHLLVLPGLAVLLIFKYLPMYGIVMAFQNFNPGKGIFGSDWVGFKHIIDYFEDPYFYRTMRNTFLLGFYTLLFSFPAPIILALLFNEIRNRIFKRVVQTISYMPYFLSTVIVVGLVIEYTNLSEGLINNIIEMLGGQRINFFALTRWFRPLYILSGIWQGVGFGTIIYLAALSGVDEELYEAAVIDGAGRFKQMRYITLPGITPTITIMLILAVGGILGNDFQKILLMYRPGLYEVADVVSTYVYRAGIEGANYSYSTAIGLFLSVVSFVFLYSTNKISKKFGDTYLW
ncbi:MAG TPA: sugar ABC transporter permease [Clostridiales bacterium]|nr:sugar ABC transporter permease [Clostridiales bacterium]